MSLRYLVDVSIRFAAAVALASVLGCAKSPPAAQLSVAPAGPSASVAQSGTSDDSQLTLPSRERSINVLTNTNVFAGTAVGEGAEPSEEALAFARIFNQEDADALFKQLLKQGTLAGQLYALCGLYFSDQPVFQSAVTSLKDSKYEVDLYWGCLRWSRPASELAQSSSPAAVRLSDADDNTAAWFDRNKDITSDGIDLDLLGGGYPDLFRQFALKHRP